MELPSTDSFTTVPTSTATWPPEAPPQASRSPAHAALRLQQQAKLGCSGESAEESLSNSQGMRQESFMTLDRA